jgi:rare lipoprotein A
LTIQPARLRRLRMRRALHGTTALVGLVLSVGVIHFALQTNVTLIVDGRPQAVRTTSTNVRDLLLGEGISLTANVLVVPSPATPLADGMTVMVSPAPGAPIGLSTSLTPDPTDVGVWVVAGTSDRYVSPDADRLVESSISASSAGTSPAVSVRAVVSGKVHDVLTNAGTAGELLSAMGITPDADDRVQPPPSTPLHHGAVVAFDRVDIQTRLEATTVPFRTLVSFSSAMTPGTRRVLSQGHAGVGRATYQITLVNGRPESKQLIGRWVEVASRPERVVSGPESMYAGTTQVPGTSGRTQTGLATWYDPPWSGLTAAHPSLRFGTHVTVTDIETGRSVTVVIDDRGPFAPGKIIDLSPEAFQILEPLGHGVIHVRLSW